MRYSQTTAEKVADDELLMIISTSGLQLQLLFYDKENSRMNI